MKKISVWAMMAAVASLCLLGCKSKSENQASTSETQTEAAGQSETAGAEAGAESTLGNLEDYYMVCPFCFQVEGKVDADGNPVTVTRQWICGSSVGVSTVADWVVYTQDPRFPFNVDGWHFVGKDIVNADETYKIVDDDVTMSLSSYCDIHTEKYVKPEKVEAYEHVTFGCLYSIEEAEMEAPQLKTSGNRHEYKGEVLEYINDSELQDRVITSFYLQEWVEVQFPAELANEDITLAVMKYQPQYENVTFDADKLSESLWTGKPELDEQSGRATVSFYVGEEQPAGFYDLVIIKGQKAQHRLSLLMTQEKK